jgi:hypothetical protein
MVKGTNVSEVIIASNIRLMMEAANTSKIAVNIYHTTQHDIPEDSHLHTHCCENLKPH